MDKEMIMNWITVCCQLVKNTIKNKCNVLDDQHSLPFLIYDRLHTSRISNKFLDSKETYWLVSPLFKKIAYNKDLNSLFYNFITEDLDPHTSKYLKNYYTKRQTILKEFNPSNMQNDKLSKQSKKSKTKHSKKGKSLSLSLKSNNNNKTKKRQTRRRSV